jgi:hypothetical protein
MYRQGLHGFKLDEKRAYRFFSKVVHKPDDKQIWGYEYDGDDDENALKSNEPQQLSSTMTSRNAKTTDIRGIGTKLLFDDNTTATTITTQDHDISISIDLLSLTEKVKCEVCSVEFNRKDLMGGTRCRWCR